MLDKELIIVKKAKINIILFNIQIIFHKHELLFF